MYLTLTAVAKPADLGAISAKITLCGAGKAEKEEDQAGVMQVEMVLMAVSAQVEVSSPPGHSGEGAVSLPGGSSGSSPVPSPSPTHSYGTPWSSWGGLSPSPEPLGRSLFGVQLAKTCFPPFHMSEQGQQLPVVQGRVGEEK